MCISVWICVYVLVLIGYVYIIAIGKSLLYYHVVYGSIYNFIGGFQTTRYKA